MRNCDMIMICNRCRHHMTIYYADGSNGIGCLAHKMESRQAKDIRNMERCPLGKDEKR